MMAGSFVFEDDDDVAVIGVDFHTGRLARAEAKVCIGTFMHHSGPK